MNNTALGAESIIFISEAHEKFYYEKLKEVRYQDVYHKALCYCLGINDDTRRNANRIYDFKTGAEQIINAPLADLHEFKDHPFKVLDDEKMEETTESIRLYGVLVPGIARPRAGGGYELIAGHRRKHGSERAGKTEMPIIIRNYSDDEATIIMVDSNIQREDYLAFKAVR